MEKFPHNENNFKEYINTDIFFIENRQNMTESNFFHMPDSSVDKLATCLSTNVKINKLLYIYPIVFIFLDYIQAKSLTK